ncbi:oxygen-independent coproporphyrinogen III oxidase [Mucilaginibacter sp. AK015]|uniref:oxygen-independent coproporphyrinogen III oxidase n=1 Tax=Mucilaginibacter sp. AK015 TaxID=2723072 RepID=UPI001622965A|nr:oxygen-independent coproporphyrinogen III oxidase [Mucilaginibacter sp. AK015]MBB5396887.1 oxygen-independent coproporphyrinogen-3 oxidase [Mucilaginibacter sp. AK015]
MDQYPYLVAKYNIPSPRYTSYPTMPYWDVQSYTEAGWIETVKLAFDESNAASGISLYVHLPFCENLCTYCGCNTRVTKNHGVEEPYINAVLQEWAMYKAVLNAQPLIREIHLGGGTPTFFSPENLDKLLGGLLKGTIRHEEAEFSFEAHPANTRTDHLQILYNHGFRRLSLGIQDFDPKVQFIINRHQTVEQVFTVTQEARRIGYTSINYDLIYGLPLQTVDGLTDTMNIVAGLKPDRIAFYSYAHVPWIKPGQRRFTEADLPAPELKSKLHDIGRSLLTHFGYQEIGMDHFALPGDELLVAAREGALHRNFMGYTHQHTQLLIGLGVSSISDSWHGFAQNVKTVEEYLSKTAAGEFPLLKGHLLSEEDLLLRQLILDIMCKGEARWGALEELPAIRHAQERLRGLAEDGLVKLTPDGLRVTSLGNRFLRNICMCMDAKLWAAQPTTQLFSMAV